MLTKDARIMCGDAKTLSKQRLTKQIGLCLALSFRDSIPWVYSVFVVVIRKSFFYTLDGSS